MELKCFKVTCVDSAGSEHEVGVMTSDESAAMNCAVMTLKEGSHIDTKAVKAEPAEAI